MLFSVCMHMRFVDVVPIFNCVFSVSIAYVFAFSFVCVCVCYVVGMCDNMTFVNVLCCVTGSVSLIRDQSEPETQTRRPSLSHSLSLWHWRTNQTQTEIGKKTYTTLYVTGCGCVMMVDV